MPGILAIVAMILAAVGLGWFGFRWEVANMLAELTLPSQEDSLAVARAAVDLSSRDPLPQWLLSTKLKEDFSPESIEASVASFEATVRKSPYDFRWWIELARAYEQAERPDEAERAFKRAIELAPGYTLPQWQIGNFYLRQGRVDEAFGYLSKTTEKSYAYRQQVFALAWDYFDKDPSRLERLAVDTPGTRVTLAQFFADHAAPDEAVRVWNTVPPEEKAKNPDILPAIVYRLYSQHFYRQAQQLAHELGVDPDAQFETVTNPGFEKFIGDAEGSRFNWKISRADSKLELSTDSGVRAEGQRSLKLNFKTYTKPELYNAAQLVTVQPAARYRLSFMLRVENLRTGGGVLLEVAEANGFTPLARTSLFPLGSQDWQRVTLEFTVPDGCDGVEIRTIRETCGEVCPITGVVWYDDFKLERL